MPPVTQVLIIANLVAYFLHLRGGCGVIGWFGDFGRRPQYGRKVPTSKATAAICFYAAPLACSRPPFWR